MNFQLGILVQIPAFIIGVIACNRFGRKKTTIVHILILAVALVSVAFIPNKGNAKWGRVFFGMVGRYSVTLGFMAIYTWSAEIFPTHIRSTGMGFCQVMARVGSICSPWIAKGLKVVHPTLPFITMGALALFGVVLLFWLPETKDVADLSSSNADSRKEGATEMTLLNDPKAKDEI